MLILGPCRSSPVAGPTGGGAFQSALRPLPPRLSQKVHLPRSTGSALPLPALLAGAACAARARARTYRQAAREGEEGESPDPARSNGAAAVSFRRGPSPEELGERPPWEPKEPTEEWKKRQKVREARLRRAQEAYKPGEGYASNALPFAGVAPYNGATNVVQARVMAKRAREIGRKIQARRERLEQGPRDDTAVQRIPVLATEAQRLNVADSLLPAVQSKECSARLCSEVVHGEGNYWQHIELEGRPGAVRTASLRLMASLVPQRAAAE